MEDIKNWTIEDIREFHSTYYQPKNAILIVAGDIKADEVFKVAKEKFEHIKNTKDIPKVHEVEPKQDGAKRVIIHKESEAQMVAIAYHIPNFKDPDQVALSALSELLSRGKSSILNKELVDKKRLVNTIYAYNMEEIDPGLFLFLAVCNPGVKAEVAEEEILKIIKLIQEGKFSQEEIKKIKTNAKSDFIHSLEVSSSLVNMYGSYMIKGDITPLTNYLENLEKLSKDDIVRVANKYLIPSNSTTIILRKDDK
jgi:predicted Zn-dependent peptidase